MHMYTHNAIHTCTQNLIYTHAVTHHFQYSTAVWTLECEDVDVLLSPKDPTVVTQISRTKSEHLVSTVHVHILFLKMYHWSVSSVQRGPLQLSIWVWSGLQQSRTNRGYVKSSTLESYYKWLPRRSDLVAVIEGRLLYRDVHMWMCGIVSLGIWIRCDEIYICTEVSLYCIVYMCCWFRLLEEYFIYEPYQYLLNYMCMCMYSGTAL